MKLSWDAPVTAPTVLSSLSNGHDTDGRMPACSGRPSSGIKSRSLCLVCPPATSRNQPDQRMSLLATLGQIQSLLGDERVILGILIRHGRMTKPQIAKHIRWDEVRVSKTLTSLKSKELIQYHSIGAVGFFDASLPGSVALGEPRFSWGPVIPVFRQFNLLCDSNRVAALRAAVEAVVQPGNVVLDLGCGLGYLSLLAARRGARIIAVEVDPFVAEAAEYLLKTHLDSGCFELFNADARTFECETKADVIICEMLDTALISELQVPTMNRAVAHLLRPGGSVIPASAETVASLVSVDYRVDGWDFPFPFFDTGDVNRVASELSRPVAIHQADFGRHNEEHVVIQQPLVAHTSGVANAVRLETSVIFHGDVKTSSSQWLNPPLTFPIESIPVRTDKTVRLDMDYYLGGTLNAVQVSVRSSLGGG